MYSQLPALEAMVRERLAVLRWPAQGRPFARLIRSYNVTEAPREACRGLRQQPVPLDLPAAEQENPLLEESSCAWRSGLPVGGTLPSGAR